MGKGLILVLLFTLVAAGCTTTKGGFCALSLPLRHSCKAVSVG